MQELIYLDSYEPTSWMHTAPYMEHLTLGELTWPGAHNAGMNAAPSLRNGYMACQDGPIDWQLQRGARALDLRFEAHRDDDKKTCFRLHGSGTGRRLSDIIQTLRRFLDEHPQEFIVLDLHRLSGLNGHPFDYQGFNNAILHGLGERLVPYANRHLTLRQLRAGHPTQRIVLACPWHPELDSPLYWPQIRHKWSGKALVMTDALHKYLCEVMADPPGNGELWSLSATSCSLFGVRRITKQLDHWFDDRKDWIRRCCVVNADFFDKSSIVRNCVYANIAKGMVKRPSLGHRDWHLCGEGGIIQRR